MVQTCHTLVKAQCASSNKKHLSFFCERWQGREAAPVVTAIVVELCHDYYH